MMCWPRSVPSAKRCVRASVRCAGSCPARGRTGGARHARVPVGDGDAGELAVSGGFGLQSRSEPLSNMRQVIASRLVESKQTVPHYQVSMVFDMDPMVEMRSTLNEQLAARGQAHIQRSRAPLRPGHVHQPADERILGR